MDRRVLLAGLAASAVAVPALAQTSGGSSMQQQPGAAGASGMAGTSAGATSRMGGQMSQADMQHMQRTMMLGTLALETSRIAQEKAQNADLKQFAQFEIQEQQTLSEVLRSMMEPAATAATGATAGQGAAGGTAATGSAAGANMQMTGQSPQLVEQLRQASGAEFDRQYLQIQLQGHRDLLQAQETYLQSNPQNREHMNVAKMARGHIREHIAMLEKMQQSLR
jgi:putative membrane protein